MMGYIEVMSTNYSSSMATEVSYTTCKSKKILGEWGACFLDQFEVKVKSTYSSSHSHGFVENGVRTEDVWLVSKWVIFH